jgi:hypothetical protein
VGRERHAVRDDDGDGLRRRHLKCGDACIYVGDVCPSSIPNQDLACALCIDCTGCTATETSSPLPKSKAVGNLM